jgi:hypothetical protein
MSNREARGRRQQPKKEDNPFAEFEELRRSATSTDDDFEVDDSMFDEGRGREEPLFLGMTAVERMFLSMFLFMNVVVLGIAALLATGRLTF